MKNFEKIIISALILFLYTSPGFTQSGIPAVYDIFDDAINIQNTGLANGTEYVERHIVKNNKHKYLNTPEYQNGTVIYNGQPYYNIDLKYNIFDDLLLVQIPTAGGSAAFQLYKEEVSAFKIDNHSFISVKENPDEKPQFHEVLLNDNNSLLLKKHLKKIRKHLDQNFTYFEFEKDSPEYLFSSNGNYYKVGSRRAIRKLFPNQEEQIKIFYRANSSLQKSDPDKFMTLLFQDLLSSASELKN